MNDIEVNVTWQTAFSTPGEVQKFKRLLGEVHARMYATDVATEKLVEDGYYEGTVNYIEVDVNDHRKEHGVFKEGDTVRILGKADTDPNHEGRVDFVQNGQVHVSNMNMPFAGSTNKFFKPNELKHYNEKHS